MLNKPSEDCYFLKLPHCTVSLAVLITGNKLLCNVSYRKTLFVLRLWPFNTTRLLNLSSPILDRNHVFRRRADEIARQQVAGFTASSLVWTSWIRPFSFLVLETFTPLTGFRQNMISSPPLTKLAKYLAAQVAPQSTSSLYDACFKKLELCVTVVTIAVLTKRVSIWA